MPATLVASALLAAAQASSMDLAPNRAEAPPKIDGTIGELEWGHATHVDRPLYNEQTGVVSDDKAEFWLMYDGKALYLAARARTDPRKIISDEFRSNVNLGQNDAFLFAIDPKGGTNFNQFNMGAGGGYEIRLAGGRAAKTEWLGEMEVQSRITATGWETEARIPWSVMDMPGPGTHAMRFNMAWFRSVIGNAFLYQYGGQGQASWPFLTGVATGRIEHPRTLKLLPYGYAGVDDSGNAIINSGLDIKAPLGTNLDFVGTVNPDFRNVENDILSLDFSYFARLANDPRPFFQEGSQYRHTGFFQRTFASQNVQNIDYGLNVYGAPDSRSQLGLLSTVDIGKQQTVVGSYTRQLTPLDNLGVTYVADFEPGIRSHTLDLNYGATRGRWNFYGGVRGTDDTVTRSGLQTDLNANYNDNHGFNNSLSFTSISADYQPRLGFTPEADTASLSEDINLTRSFARGPLREWFQYIGLSTANHVSGGFYRNSVGSYQQLRFRNGVELGFFMGRPNFQGSADQESNAHIVYPYTDGNRNVSLDLNTSRYGDTPFHKTSFQWASRPAKRVQTNLGAEFVDFGGAQTQIIGSIRFDRGRYESFGLRLVRRNSDLNWNLSYRMSGKRGNEYFISFGDANSLTFKRQLVIKVVAPIELRF